MVKWPENQAQCEGRMFLSDFLRINVIGEFNHDDAIIAFDAIFRGHWYHEHMGAYDKHPKPFLTRLHQSSGEKPEKNLCCAGFEFEEWRCSQFAEDLIGWLPDYALVEDELQVDHANAYEKLRQAAVRVYSSDKYKKRGEVGEIALHSICRVFFKTVPISPRVFYKSTSNDVIKSFDLVHARFPVPENLEIWLGESKLYANRSEAIVS